MSKMKPFHKIIPSSLFVLSMAIIASAHALEPTPITQADCGMMFPDSNTTFALDEDITCSAGDNPVLALEFSGDNNHFFLQGHSITAEKNNEPNLGINITGNANYVIGPGTVEGFNNTNIIILNASDNHVSKLHLINGLSAISISTSGATEQAKGNNIYDNIIINPNFGIILNSYTGENVRENNIYYNHIEGTEDDAILVRDSSNNQIHYNSILEAGNRGIEISSINARANANQIYNNHIQGTRNEGILVSSSGIVWSANSNQIYDNEIQKAGSIGISILANAATNTANENTLLRNDIIDPGSFAIALLPFGNGTVADNVITYNTTKHQQAAPVYCDNAREVNHWRVNFTNFQPETGTPDSC